MNATLKIGLLTLLISVAWPLQNASAIPVGGTLIDDSSFTFDTGLGYAIIDCQVFQYTSGDFVYAYQILNQNSPIGFSLFSVGITDGVNATSPSYDSDPIAGWVNPFIAVATGTPVQTIDYHFIMNTLDTTEISAVLWFVSDSAPGLGVATLYGANIATTDIVKVPVPEPLTFSLLAGGGMLLFTRKRRLS
jgi:hypothetical protein